MADESRISMEEQIGYIRRKLYEKELLLDNIPTKGVTQSVTEQAERIEHEADVLRSVLESLKRL